MMKKLRIVSLIFLLSSFSYFLFSQSHPIIVLTANGVKEIQAQLNQLPLLKESLQLTINEVEEDMATGIHVPIPKDMAGGYTHERHKKNFLTLQKAGVLFQITENEKYAIYVRDVLLEYAKLYPTLSKHPANRSYAPGKLFWQCLNDANWLVYVSQAYDCIYNWLTPEERNLLEQNLFRPYADYISIESPQFFNRIHNHSTWGIAAVGMIGLVMGDQELIDRALYGLDEDTISIDQKDDDGGLIKMPGQTNAGFFAQLDFPFSPDGYYTEGPYYQRYAMYPFLLFAESLENCRPDLRIFEYKDSVLVKAVFALINLSDTDGEFFPINDAQKGMSYLSRELVSSVDIIYHFGGNNLSLLSIAKLQNKVLLDDTGLSVAKGLNEGKEQPFVKKSIQYRDGPNGDGGAVGIIRTGDINDELCLVMKYTSQGLGHGHFDKLSFSLYDKGEEVLQDYGVARFVNIDQKYGGGYLPENRTWAKQSIAHNTLVVNQKSHFKGNFDVANLYHSNPYFFNAKNEAFQIMSAKDTNAYPGIEMHRTMAVISDTLFEKPLVIDIFRVKSDIENQYDLPYHFLGQIMSTNFDYTVPASLSVMGKNYGYQHLWKEAEGKLDSNTNAKLTWLSNKRFYTLTTLSSSNDKLLFTRLGANDPEFNLRRDASFIIRKNNEKNAIYVSVIEPHGNYSPVSEIATNAFSNITDLELIINSDKYTAVSFSNKTGHKWVLIFSNEDVSKDTRHELEITGKNYKWAGPFKLYKQ
jgi:oligo-alginate lyase